MRLDKGFHPNGMIDLHFFMSAFHNDDGFGEDHEKKKLPKKKIPIF